MRTALDTNILSALLSDEPTAGWVSSQLASARINGSLVISGPVLSEIMGYPQTTLNIIKAFLDKTGCQVDYDLDEAVWIRAGEIYAIYAARRRASKDEPRRLITDFIIGAHASLKADQLMTLDAVRYRKNFPSLTLITHAP